MRSRDHAARLLATLSIVLAAAGCDGSLSSGAPGGTIDVFGKGNGKRCGNGTCSADERCSSCPEDCGRCADGGITSDLRSVALDAQVPDAPTPTDSTPTDSAPTTPTPTGVPQVGDFPTRSSVGPTVEPTQVYQGDCNFDASDNGTVIDGKIINCDSTGVRFDAATKNVVIRNSVIYGSMATIGNTPGDPGADTYPRDPVFTVESSRIIQHSTASGDRAACCAHYVIKHSLIEGTHSGIGAHNNVTLIGNHITTDGTDTHQSGLRMLKNSTLRGNTVTCKPVAAGYDGSGCSAHAVFYREDLGGNPAAAYNLTIESNYFKRGVTSSGAEGGPYFAVRFIDCAAHSDCTGIKFTGNLFSLNEGTDGAEFPFYAGNVWAGNYWVDGQPAASGQGR